MTLQPVNENTATSLSLLQRVRARDQQACDRFARLYAPLLYRWACQLGLQDSDAADITQDVLIVVSEKIGTFQRDQAGQSLRAWLRTIVRNRCRDLVRARHRHAQAIGGTDAVVTLQQVEQDTSSGSNEEEDEALVVHAAVELLKDEFSPNTWMAFVQTAVEGRRAADVAADLQMSVGAIYTAKSRVLSRFRSEFADLL
jgi:RNA polymerase sigma-70 factor (ECF subfamily)